MTFLNSVEQLEKIYGLPGETSTLKVIDRITDNYRQMIEVSPFAVLATCGPEGLDCSPRGDLPGFVRIVDEQTLQLPDRRGNNRIDSLRNIVRDSRVALLFFLPGCGITLRVNATARVNIDPELLSSFEVDTKTPRSVIVLKTNEIYFQCARAIIRSDIWNPEKFIDPVSLPTAGKILAELTSGSVGGDSYDRQWPERAKRTMW